MALLDQINGSLILRFSPSSSSSSTSTVGGQGLGASFDSGAVDVATGLATTSQAFVDSYVRINSAISGVVIAEDRLSRLSELAIEMYDISSTAAEADTRSEERERLNVKLSDLVTQYEDILAENSSGSVDLLSVTDLRALLSDAGVDLDAASELAQAVADAGGADGYLGTETVLNDAQTLVDPLSQNVLTQEAANNAKVAIGELKKELATDLASMQTVRNELAGAISFATEAAVAFSEAAESQPRANEAEELAQQIVATIRSRTSDPMLAAHSDIDSELSRVLLGK